MQTILYSVIIPLKNEEENIIPLLEELQPVMDTLKESWEVICINDGSTDKTEEILQNYKKNHGWLRLITFDKNYGQSSAFDAGFRHAKGKILISLDGDGQNDPHDIPKLLPLIDTNDLVCGIRQKRHDNWGKRSISKIANKVRGWVCDDGVKDTGCSLKIYKRDALESIKLFNGMHRFLPALFLIEGFKVAQLPVNHRPRQKGRSNYNIWNRSLNTLFDLFAVAWMKKRHLNYKVEKIDHS